MAKDKKQQLIKSSSQDDKQNNIDRVGVGKSERKSKILLHIHRVVPEVIGVNDLEPEIE